MIRRRIEGRGLWLVADVAGDPMDPAVVFLHAGGQTRHFWKRSARNLVRAGHHVVALDLRGHGDSEWAQDGDYGMKAMTDDLLAVLGQFPSTSIPCASS